MRSLSKLSPGAILVCVFAAGGGIAKANDVYIAQGAAGSANGSSCANALPATYFNTSGNWTSGAPTGAQIGPGTTVHLCGTFTAPAGSDGYLQFQRGGAAGSPITILWESNAIVQAPYFSAAHGGIDVAGQSFVTLDGGSNGIIQNTLNGTPSAACSGGPCVFQKQSILVGGWGSNGTILNLSLVNVYVHSTGDASGSTAYATLARHASNFVVGPGNTMSQCDVCIMYEWNGGESNFTVQGNSFLNSNQSIQMGPTTTGAVFSNVTVSGNTDHDWNNWDDPGNHFHHNFFHPFTNLTGAALIGNLYCYNNYVYGDMGDHATSFLFIENNNGGAGGTMASWYIFNNVFDHTSTVNAGSSGLIAATSDNGFLYNNTVVDAGGTGGNSWIGFNSYGTGWTVTNNIFQGENVYIWLEGSSISGDANVYYNSSNATPWRYQSINVPTITMWRTYTSSDAHSVTSNPLLNLNWTLQPGSPAIGLASNLRFVGITTLDSDKAGDPRPIVPKAWDGGVYEYGGAGILVNPPSQLTAAVQ